MTAEQIVASFRARMCGEIDLLPEGVGRYVVANPFVHDDGDALLGGNRDRIGRFLTEAAHA